MELIVALIIGIVLGAITLYFIDHKHNISYALTTLKEDMTNLQVKLDKYFSTIK
jgi:uncharacterized membrane-anchored protein YhcB (DUF1043 family)